ncbi:MAG TPA: OmpH family outer membrane protein [Candidatus Kapabacteria bacterium]|nr:OmpH family outer membrane protein [Candidatus Kapabacteria bacterium]
MQTVKRFFFFIAAFAVVLSQTSVKTYAQKIGVVDGNEVLNTLDEAKKADDKIKPTGKMWQDSLAMMQKAAQDKQAGYQKILSTMSDDAKQKAQADLDQMGREMQSYQTSKFDQTNGELVKLRTDLVKPILDKIKSTIATVAKKKKLDIILDKNSTIYNSENVTEITKDVESALK